MIYLLTAIGLSPGGSTHLHTNNTQNNTNNNWTTQIQTNVEECGPCPVFASFTLAFALQLRKKHGKSSVRVRKTSVRLRKTSVKVQYTYYQKHPHITKPSQTHTLQNPQAQILICALISGEFLVLWHMPDFSWNFPVHAPAVSCVAGDNTVQYCICYLIILILKDLVNQYQ